MEEFVPQTHTSEELGVRRDMCELIHRAYGNQLFTSDQGTFSCKLSDGSFIITKIPEAGGMISPSTCAD